MVTDPDCLFCRIVAHELPSTIVHEDDLVVAFRDIAPVAPTHILIVPRTHIIDAGTVETDDADVLAAMVATAQRLAREEGIFGSGFRLVFNVGDDAGNSVAHLHLHLLGGRVLAWPPG